MFLLFLLTVAEIPWQPPGFPQLSQDYIQWQEYVPILRADEGYSEPAFWRTHNLNPMQDTSEMPFELSVPDYTDVWVKGDSSFGQAKYYNTLGPYDERPDDLNVVVVRWFPHEEPEPGLLVETYLLADPDMELEARYVAYERGHPELMELGEGTAYRKRLRWWRCSDDSSFHITGSATFYLVQAEQLDFHITCLTTTYKFDDQRLGQESEDELDRPRIKTWPDAINEFENAVESSFKIKEGI